MWVPSRYYIASFSRCLHYTLDSTLCLQEQVFTCFMVLAPFTALSVHLQFLWHCFARRSLHWFRSERKLEKLSEAPRLCVEGKKKRTWNVASVNPAIVTCASGFYFLVSFFSLSLFLPCPPPFSLVIVLPPFPPLSPIPWKCAKLLDGRPAKPCSFG